MMDFRQDRQAGDWFQELGHAFPGDAVPDVRCPVFAVHVDAPDALRWDRCELFNESPSGHGVQLLHVESDAKRTRKRVALLHDGSPQGTHFFAVPYPRWTPKTGH
jgi:hypothetical protein